MTYFQVYKVRHSYEAVYAMKFSNELMINFLILINVFLSCLKNVKCVRKTIKSKFKYLHHYEKTTLKSKKLLVLIVWENTF